MLLLDKRKMSKAYSKWCLSDSLQRYPVSMPEKFSGQMDMFPAFLGQCQLFMSLRPEDFPTDRSKVGFMISLLTGQAANWATPLLVQDSPLLNNFQGFLQQMRVIGWA
uniref:DUF4939 domain-containing protein n=1 Tax=Pseudonaja textilis TaxID=8673 RepID=A0A670YQL2_PSETE